MAFHGILKCLACEDSWFGGVARTSGSGSSRTGANATFTDAQMMSSRYFSVDVKDTLSND